MDITKTFALLAPVPESHLQSGLESIAQQFDLDIIPPFVVYGTMAFEVFAEVERLRKDKAVEVFIYATDSTGDRPLNAEVTWKGLYIGREQASGGGRYRGKAIHRPAATASERDKWGIFWKVTQLEAFKTGLPIGKLQAFTTHKPCPPRLIPDAPLLIDYPYNQAVFLKR
jgi:hypothetical protein